MRSIVLAVLLTAVTAGLAFAQIAAPSLVPAPPFANFPTNPATMSWDSPSRMGLAYGVGDVDAGGGLTGDVDIIAANAIFIGATLSAGATHSQVTLDVPGAPSTPIVVTNTELRIAAQFGGWMAVGLGHEQSDRDDSLGFEHESIPSIGAAFRAGAIYFGVNAGSGEVSRPAVLSESRDVMRYGIAYHSVDKSGGLHLEYAVETRDNTPTNGADSKDNTLVNAEARFGSFLVGYLSQHRVEKNILGATTVDQDQATVTVGWVPEHGIAYTLSHLDLSGTGGPSSLTATTLGLTWLF